MWYIVRPNYGNPIGPLVVQDDGSLPEIRAGDEKFSSLRAAFRWAKVLAGWKVSRETIGGRSWPRAPFLRSTVLCVEDVVRELLKDPTREQLP